MLVVGFWLVYALFLRLRDVTIGALNVFVGEMGCLSFVDLVMV